MSRKILLCAVLILACVVGDGGAVGQASDPRLDHRTLTIESGSGQVIELRSAATNVFVADPKVAEVRPASPTSLFVFGVGAGQTTVAAMDTAGHLVAQYEVTVHPSPFGATEAQAAILRLMPGSRVRAQAQIKGMMLSGRVNSPAEAAQAMAIAHGYLGENQVVDNQLSVQSNMQVTLRVRIAEVSRTVVQNLGINWGALGNIGRIGTIVPALALVTGAVGTSASAAAPVAAGLGAGFSGVIDALAQDSLAHILAEPNLTVISGQSASFQVGGEFPIPVGQQNGQISIEFKQFGVMLSFLPTVLSDGRINVHVKPEVSDLDYTNGIQLGSGNTTFKVPGLKTRRAESTVELGSGQSFAIAGLLQDNVSDAVNGLPYLKDVPVLGALFRSDAFNRQETELVILVTPFVVKPASDEALLHLPTDGFTPPTDLERILLTRQVGRPSAGQPVRMAIPGDAGFIVQ
jgi:pilus assembly protein CpaC